ncbi:MAG: acetylxylan esterase [Candidatus Omnitrophica bacterium]|nr:acetylxylan esterase [Candidatus Omnitrophota bacterium]
MPLIDMPLKELMVYPGRNPCPADFDEYWDKGLAEMKSLDPQIELVPQDTGSTFAECFGLYFTGVGGSRIYAKYLRPKKSVGRHPAVVMFHGYSQNSGEWWDKLVYGAQGFSVFALDCRGQGGLSQDMGGVTGNTFKGQIIRGLDDKPEKLLFRSIFLDCAQLAGIAMKMPEVDEKRVGALGGSQGGGLTLACAALEPGIKKAAPVFPFLCDYQRAWEMDLAKGAYEELANYFRQFDPLHERESEIFMKLGYIDNQHLAKRIRAEVLMPVGLMDTTCPPSTQFAAYNKITSTKNLLIYPDFGHEGLPGVNDLIFKFMATL